MPWGKLDQRSAGRVFPGCAHHPFSKDMDGEVIVK
jgi:hypothetical protein